MLIASDFTGAVSVIQFWDHKVNFINNFFSFRMAAYYCGTRQTQDGTY